MMRNNNILNFLQYCKSFSEKEELTDDVVYSFLENYNLKDEDIDSNMNFEPTDYRSGWYDDLKDRKNITFFENHDYWACFYHNSSIRRYIKLYISLDREHLYDGVKKIVSFISDKDLNHQTKSTSHVRTDNVIVRLSSDDYDALDEIINFINNDTYLQEGMNDVNPFIPTIGKIGVMYDDGRSYNSDLALLIAEYIDNTKSLSEINIKEFCDFIKSKKKDDVIFLSTFVDAFLGESKYKKFIRNNEVDFDYNESEIINIDDNKMFELAVLNTFKKHDNLQAVGAILKALEGDYDYFSNRGNGVDGKEIEYREYLKNNLSSEKIKKIILDSNTDLNVESFKNIVESYVNKLIYKYEGIYLEEALVATALAYDDSLDDICSRLSIYCFDEDATVFVKYNSDVKEGYNFRNAVEKNVSSQNVSDVIKSILFYNDLEYLSDSFESIHEQCAELIKNKLNKSKKH